MTISYTFESLKEILPPTKLMEIENEISESISFLEKNLNRLLDYLKKENDLGNYIEIDLPVLNLSISYRLNLFYDKLMVSVVSWDNSEIFGHLILKEYDCLDLKGIREMGDWKKQQQFIKKLRLD